MLQEIILVVSCLAGKACEQTRFTYLHYNTSVKEQIRVVEGNLQRMVPRDYHVEHITPVLVAIARKEFNLPLNKNFTIGYNQKEDLYSTKLTYGMDY